jgi:hypothetical protein
MAGGCCGGCAVPTAKQEDQAWRRALWIALAINAAMFGVEVAAGVSAQSASLKADALDFLGDAANYAISLGVAGLACAYGAGEGRLADPAERMDTRQHRLDGGTGNAPGRRDNGHRGRARARR